MADDIPPNSEGHPTSPEVSFEKISLGLYKVTEQMPCEPTQLKPEFLTYALGDFNAGQIGLVLRDLAEQNGGWIGASDGFLAEKIMQEKQKDEQSKSAGGVQSPRTYLDSRFLKSQFLLDNILKGSQYLEEEKYVKVEKRTLAGGITENILFPTSLMVEAMKKQQDRLQEVSSTPAETTVKV